jgi:hypothetical protein
MHPPAAMSLQGVRASIHKRWGKVERSLAKTDQKGAYNVRLRQGTRGPITPELAVNMQLPTDRANVLGCKSEAHEGKPMNPSECEK